MKNWFVKHRVLRACDGGRPVWMRTLEISNMFSHYKHMMVLERIKRARVIALVSLAFAGHFSYAELTQKTFKVTLSEISEALASKRNKVAYAKHLIRKATEYCSKQSRPYGCFKDIHQAIDPLYKRGAYKDHLQFLADLFYVGGDLIIEPSVRKILVRAETLKAYDLAARAENTLGNIEKNKLNFEKALSYFKKASDYNVKSKEGDIVLTGAISLNHIGILNSLGHLDQAIKANRSFDPKKAVCTKGNYETDGFFMLEYAVSLAMKGELNSASRILKSCKELVLNMRFVPQYFVKEAHVIAAIIHMLNKEYGFAKEEVTSYLEKTPQSGLPDRLFANSLLACAAVIVRNPNDVNKAVREGRSLLSGTNKNLVSANYEKLFQAFEEAAKTKNPSLEKLRKKDFWKICAKAG